LFFGLTIVLVMVCGACNAAIQSGLFGLAAQLPPLTYTGALMAGQGMGGLLPATVAIITVAASSPVEGEKRKETRNRACFWPESQTKS
jgi:hypothetical protein